MSTPAGFGVFCWLPSALAAFTGGRMPAALCLWYNTRHSKLATRYSFHVLVKNADSHDENHVAAAVPEGAEIPSHVLMLRADIVARFVNSYRQLPITL